MADKNASDYYYRTPPRLPDNRGERPSSHGPGSGGDAGDRRQLLPEILESDAARGDSDRTPLLAGSSGPNHTISYSGIENHNTVKPPPPNRPLPFFIIVTSLAQVSLLAWMMISGGIAPICWTNDPSCNPMIGPPAETILKDGGKYGPAIRAGDWWRFLVPMFLHAGIIHLLLNFSIQLRLAWQLERDWGTIPMAFLYVFSGFGGNLLSAMFLPDVLSVGASSSLYGVIGAIYADLVYNWHTLHRPWLTLINLLVATLVSLFIGMLPLLDNWAHIGGMLMGILMGMVVVPSTKVPAQFIYADVSRGRRPRRSRGRGPLWIFIRGIVFVITVICGILGVWAFYEYPDMKCHWCKYLDTPPWQW